MASHLYRTSAMLRSSRYVPTLIARAQASQNSPTPGQGIPMTGSTKTVAQTGGTKKGDSSVLPSSSTPSDHTNPTKTSSDAPSLAEAQADPSKKSSASANRTTTGNSGSKSSSSSSFNDSNTNQSFMSSPAGKFGTIAVLSIAIYAGYKMMSGEKKNAKDPKANDPYKKAAADHQAENAKGADVKK